MTAHPSDSAEQRSAELLIVAAVARAVGVELASETVRFDDGTRVQIDGTDAEHRVLVEVYAHQGALRGAQPRKLASDALKLRWAGERLGAQRLILAVVDPDAEAYLRRPGAWLTAAISDAGVEVVRVALEDEQMKLVKEAQTRQFR